MQIEYEEGLRAKEEELIIMNNLLNSPCETEPQSNFANIEEQIIEKYEKSLRNIKAENEKNLIEMQKYYDYQIKELAKEKERLVNEISKQKQEIYKLKGYVPSKDKPHAQTHRESLSNNSNFLTEENKEKILQNLLFKIK